MAERNQISAMAEPGASSPALAEGGQSGTQQSEGPTSKQGGPGGGGGGYPQKLHKEVLSSSSEPDTGSDRKFMSSASFSAGEQDVYVTDLSSSRTGPQNPRSEALDSDSRAEMQRRNTLVKYALSRSQERNAQIGEGMNMQDLERKDEFNAPSRVVQAHHDFKGSRIIFCRARGMPMDHNSQTAYFEITSNKKHGSELICSHLGCRNGGVKFLYCKFCQQPVAKRNFWARHNHNQQKAGLKDDGQHGSSTSSSSTGVQFQGGIPAQVTTKESKKRLASFSNVAEKAAKHPKVSSNSSQQASSNTSSETGSTHASNSSVTSLTHSDERRDGEGGTAKLSTSKGTNKESSKPKSLHELNVADPKRMLEWGTLLGRRPPTDSSAEISSWLMDVLAVSDLQRNYNSSTTDISNDSSSEERGTNNISTDSSAPTDQSGTAGSSRTDGSSANDSSTERETNNGSTDSSRTDGSLNDSSNDSSSDTQEPANGSNDS